MNLQPETRIVRRDPNLDLLRATAITLVVGLHSVSGFANAPPWLSKCVEIGGYGVDLFFVLSGWLIGSLWFREQIREGHVHPLRFMSRRWMRMLPPYYVAMIIGWLGVYVSRHRPFDFGYVIFIQNFYERLPFFSVSWSLCIEEHFYLLLPWILLLAMCVCAPVMLAAGALIVIAPLWRWYLWRQTGEFRFGYMTTATHLHAEGLTIGVIAAAIAAYRPAQWKKIKRIARWLAIPAVLLYLSFIFWPWQYQYIIGLTVLALIWVIVLAAVESAPPILWADSRIIYWIAISSYSLYLTHLLILHTAQDVTRKFFAGNWIAQLPLMLAGYVFFGGLFYLLIERSSIQLRDRVLARKPAIEVAGGPV